MPDTRILSVIASADVGGAEVHLEHVARFVDAKHTIVALADGPMVGHWRGAGAEVILLPVPGKSPIGAIGGFERICAASGAAIVHSHTPKANLLAAMSRLRAPHVMTIHGSHRQFVTTRALPASWYRWADLWSSRRASRVIAVCESDRRELAESGFSPAKLITVPNGVPDPGIYDQLSARLSPPDEVVWVGRLSPEKRPNVMMEIARAIGDHPRIAGIRVVGDGEMIGVLRGTRHPKVILQPHCDSLGDVWRQAAVLVNTSISEGASLVVLEAMAAGVPVVGSAVGGNRELLANAGYVVADRRDESETVGIFASIIKHFMEVESHRREIAGLARRRYLEKYRVETMGERLAEVYRGVLLDRG